MLCQFDAESVVVYQAYRREIGAFAAERGWFGGGFSFDRMSWIKPNFLWMMYRCGWASKPDQEVVLAVTLARTMFDSILAAAVPSIYHPTQYSDVATWRRAVEGSDVRLHWDPDHGPHGAPVERRAIQLGLRGPVLGAYARPLHIEDISGFAREQHARLSRDGIAALETPSEDVYPCPSAVASSLRLDTLADEMPS